MDTEQAIGEWISSSDRICRENQLKMHKNTGMNKKISAKLK